MQSCVIGTYAPTYSPQFIGRPLTSCSFAAFYCPTYTITMASVGPSLPPELVEKRKRDDGDDSEANAARSSSPNSGSKKQRVIGPSMPPAALDERLPQSPHEIAENADTDDNDDDSSDDDFGPAPPTTADALQQSTTQPTPKAAAPAALQRDEWMTMAPTNGDWSSKVDPTQLRARKFNTGKGAKAPSAATGPDDAWHETPEQKQARLQRELMGVKDKASPAPAPSKPGVHNEETATAQRLKGYNAVRGPSLFDSHQKKHDREEDDDPSKRAFDREKDIAGGLQLNSTQRRDMMKKASDFGSRFSSSKYL